MIFGIDNNFLINFSKASNNKSNHPGANELALLQIQIELGNIVVEMLREFGKSLKQQAKRSNEIHESRQRRVEEEEGELKVQQWRTEELKAILRALFTT